VHDDLSRIKRVCDREGLELLVVLIPDEMQVDPELRKEMARFFADGEAGFDLLAPNRRLAEDLRSQGIRYLDLLDPFQKAGRRARLYKPRDCHWNIAGNRLAADLVREELLRGPSSPWSGR
jgi:hypothetical protein